MSRAEKATEIRVDVFADGDLSQRLKLFTLAAIHLWETAAERRELKQFGKEAWPYKALRMMGETGTTEELSGKLRWLIYDDVPKFRMGNDRNIACCGTMLRPLGAPCKKRTTTQSTIPNPLTGERAWHGSCSDPRHRAIFEAQRKEAWAAWKSNGSPEPKPNSGGLLLRYFTSGIEQLYAWADQKYTTGDKVTEAPAAPAADIVSLEAYRSRASSDEATT